jgi:hypothetical protein
MITLTENKRNTTGTEFTVETHVLDRGTWYAVRFMDQQLPCGWAETVNEAYADLLHWQRARMR